MSGNILRASLLALLLAVVWWLWSGMTKPLILAFGAASIALTTLLSVRLQLTDLEGAPLGALIRGPIYLPWLLKEILIANLDVCRRILDPRLPIAPKVFRTRGSQLTDVGRVIYANSITLTPGTVTLRLEGDSFTIHALTAEAADALPGSKMDRKATWVEGKP